MGEYREMPIGNWPCLINKTDQPFETSRKVNFSPGSYIAGRPPKGLNRDWMKVWNKLHGDSVLNHAELVGIADALKEKMRVDGNDEFLREFIGDYHLVKSTMSSGIKVIIKELELRVIFELAKGINTVECGYPSGGGDVGHAKWLKELLYVCGSQLSKGLRELLQKNMRLACWHAMEDVRLERGKRVFPEGTLLSYENSYNTCYVKYRNMKCEWEEKQRASA